MRTLSAGMTTATASHYTAPGFLVAIDFTRTTVIYLSSRGAVTWDGKSWVPYNLRVRGLTLDGYAGQSGSVTLTNVATDLLSLIMEYGIADKRMRVWAFDASALGATDPVLLFDGYGDDVGFDSTTITLKLSPGSMAYAPRRWMNAANGFNYLPVRGQRMYWAGETYLIE